LLWSFWRWGLRKYLPCLALNLGHPDLSLSVAGIAGVSSDAGLFEVLFPHLDFLCGFCHFHRQLSHPECPQPRPPVRRAEAEPLPLASVRERERGERERARPNEGRGFLHGIFSGSSAPGPLILWASIPASQGTFPDTSPDSHQLTGAVS
jgi:hypothetical protein